MMNHTIYINGYTLKPRFSSHDYVWVHDGGMLEVKAILNHSQEWFVSISLVFIDHRRVIGTSKHHSSLQEALQAAQQNCMVASAIEVLTPRFDGMMYLPASVQKRDLTSYKTHYMPADSDQISDACIASILNGFMANYQDVPMDTAQMIDLLNRLNLSF